MNERIGFFIRRERADQTVEAIKGLERAGIASAWTIMSATGRDMPSVYAAAAMVTSRIKLGTGIVPAFPRHPIALAAQAVTINDLAPGRLRLGVGTSHAPLIRDALGIPFDRPLEHLREYLSVLRPALHTGRVQFSGTYYRVDATLAGTAPEVPVLVSALREQAYVMAGELSDGAISWLCPLPYLLERAKPALAQGAEAAGRPTPPLLAGTMVAPEADRAKALTAARAILARYARLPFYARMFADAGFAVGAGGEVGDDLIDATVVSGDDDTIGERLQSMLARGVDEVLVEVVPTGDRQEDEARLLAILARC